MRDTQKQKVYNAEHQLAKMLDWANDSDGRVVEIEGSTLVLPVERRFGNPTDVQAYVDKVLALNWVRATWPNAAPVKVRTRKGQAKAHYEPWSQTIALPPAKGVRGWALRETVVLHELAHHLTPWRTAPHGPEFVGTLVALLTEIIGPEVGFTMRLSAAQHGATEAPVHVLTMNGVAS